MLTATATPTLIVLVLLFISGIGIDSLKIDNEGQEGINNDTSNDLLQSNDPRHVGFYLYPNPENVTDSDVIVIGNQTSLVSSRYNPSRPPIILIHGFLNNYTTRFSTGMKNGFLANNFSTTHNIINVDWGKLSSPANETAYALSHINDLSKDLFYRAAVKNVPKVGGRVAEFITFLLNEQRLKSTEDVHVIGFSLGAQVSSFIKYNLTTPIGRITGLDPASPLYQTAGVSKKLDAEDASFVDIIHTNQGQDGYYGNIGHADFYPNGGGPNQPDCLDTVGIGVVENAVTGSCAHNRAWVYYVKSLTENITACRCLSQADIICKGFCVYKAYFGHYCPPTARGSYYLNISVKN